MVLRYLKFVVGDSRVLEGETKSDLRQAGVWLRGGDGDRVIYVP